MGDDAGNLTTMLTGAFGSMAEAVGSLVQQWVLMGSLGPNAMRKMAASVLASFAAQAIVKAMFSFAEGWSYKAQASAAAARHDYVSAALFTLAAKQSFAAAKLFGALGVGAALVGRAVAGDAFSQGGSASGGGGGNESRRQESDTSRDQFSRDSRYGQQQGGGAGGGGGSQGEGGPWERMARQIHQTLVEAHQTNQQLLGMVQTASPGDVLARAVDQNPSAIGTGIKRATDEDPQLGSYVLTRWGGS
jgi:hypothetical protein